MGANNKQGWKLSKQITQRKNNPNLYLVLVDLQENETSNFYVYLYDKFIDKMNTIYKKYISKPHFRTGVQKKDVSFRWFNYSDFKELCDLYDKFINDNRIVVIGNSYVELEGVIDDCFTGRKPFGEGHKKSEFPDAFILSTIEGYSNKKGVKSYVLSNDKDMIEYESETSKVIVKDSIGELIGELHEHRDEKTFNFIDARSFQSNYEVVKAVEEVYVYNFDDEVAQIVSDNPYYEEGESVVESIEVSNLEKYNILEINKEEAIIEYIFNAGIVANVNYNDLSNGFYDKEDGQWWGVEHVNEEKNYSAEIRIIVNHSFSLKDETFSIRDVESFEIESFEEV